MSSRRRRAFGAAFSPRSVTGLNLWLDADDASTITKDVSDNLSIWGDKSGIGNDVDQGVGANQPVWTDAQLNNMPSIVFDGATSFLVADIFATILNGADKPITIFIVGRTGSLVARQMAIGVENVSGAPYFSYEYNASGGRSCVNRDDASLQKSVVSSSTFDTGWGVDVLVNTGTAGELFRDGVSVSASTDLDVQTKTLSEGSIGRWGSRDQFYFNGEIAEMVVYNRAVTAPERVLIETYLNNKWGVY